nr:MAG TPA: hypothetical protein [Caudoviricetes sp.]
MYRSFLALKYSFFALVCTLSVKFQNHIRLKSPWCLKISPVQESAKKCNFIFAYKLRYPKLSMRLGYLRNF